jgi:hypothetical protein
MTESIRASLLALVIVSLLLVTSCGDRPATDDFSDPKPAWKAWADAATLEYEDYGDWVDTGYRHVIDDPAFDEGAGPVVCIDEAHFNFHTAEGFFRPFADLLRSDGYKISRFRSKFTAGALAECHTLLIANAQAQPNRIGFGSPDSNWAYPHASAFSRREIDELISWLRAGGALFLIADHAPWPAAVSDLALIIGVHMLDGYAFPSDGDSTGEVIFGVIYEELWDDSFRELEERTHLTLKDRFRLVFDNPGTLSPHRISLGRNANERVDWVVTFTGHAFQATQEWKPVLVFGQKAVSKIPTQWNLDDAGWLDGPEFSTAGRLQGAVRNLDRGRVAILGEAGMCTAQFDDLDGELETPLVPYGINASRAPHNARFCLNTMHWLSGLLDD